PPLGIAKSTHQLIWASIEERHHIRFFYDGKERITEPHDYGIQNGRVRLLVYQFAGRSNSERLPAWRLVDIAGMSEIEVLETTFPGNRPAPSGQHQLGSDFHPRRRAEELNVKAPPSCKQRGKAGATGCPDNRRIQFPIRKRGSHVTARAEVADLQCHDAVGTEAIFRLSKKSIQRA